MFLNYHYEEVVPIRKPVFIILLLLLLLLLGTLFSGAINQIPPEISTVYNNFLQAFSEGQYYDIDPYIHYEIEEHRKLNEEHFSNIIYFKIVGWKKLNSNLWVVTNNIQLEYEEVPTLCYHFIGMIDGSWKVMLGPHHVPQNLSNKLDLTGFVPPNALPVDVEIFPIF